MEGADAGRETEPKALVSVPRKLLKRQNQQGETWDGLSTGLWSVRGSSWRLDIGPEGDVGTSGDTGLITRPSRVLVLRVLAIYSFLGRRP